MENNAYPTTQYDGGRKRYLTLHYKPFSIFYKADLTEKDIRERSESANPKSENDGREALWRAKKQTNGESKLGITEAHSSAAGQNPYRSKENKDYGSCG